MSESNSPCVLKTFVEVQAKIYSVANLKYAGLNRKWKEFKILYCDCTTARQQHNEITTELPEMN